MMRHIPFFIDLAQFDALVIHYTLAIFLNHYLSPQARKKIRDFKGLKACFIQDEYRCVNKTIGALEDLGIDILFTSVPESEFKKVYTSRLKKITCVNVLTGYVPEDLPFLEVPPYAARRIDVSYRGRSLPYYLGALAQEKAIIGQKFLKDVQRYDLITDIDYTEERRLYGKKWIDFLSQSKACLGVESGASVFDFTGEIQKNVEDYLEKNPAAFFEDVQQLFFAEAEGKIKLNQISPRCFEAAALRTLMILYEGEYSGILLPWKHYVPLKKDHSNMKEVVDIVKDPGKATEIIAFAYKEIALNPLYSYQELTDIFDDTLEKHVTKKSRHAPKLTPPECAALYKKYYAFNRVFSAKRYLKYRILRSWIFSKYFYKVFHAMRTGTLLRTFLQTLTSPFSGRKN